MVSRWIYAAAPLLASFLSAPALAQDAPAVTPEQMMRHIRVLASDEFQGRKPGTEGERKTLDYIAYRYAAMGLEPAGTVGGWYQPVPLVERRPGASRVVWTRNGEAVAVDRSDFVLSGREASQRVTDAPAWFVGHGLVMPEAGIDQLAGLDLQGAIVFLWQMPPQGVANAPRYAERVERLVERGAAAVIGVLPNEVPWTNVVAASSEGSTRLQSDPVPPIGGLVPAAVVASLIGSGAAPSPAGDPRMFVPVRLDARGTLEVETAVRPYVSYNVIGRLRGTGNTGQHVLYLGHWDHLGICRPEGVADRICNGAVDNASGIAMMIEIARSIARGERPERDLLFMGTTAEEMGLLGAEHFGANPVVPLDSIVAAINIDTVAIAGRGEPVAIVGRGTTPLDPLVDETARELGRAIDRDNDANAFVQRQDGWVLTRAGVPTAMVGGSFANMEKLQAFLSGPYHSPEDDLDRPIELGGAAEDTNLLIALGRKLADPKRYQPKRN